MLFSPASGPPGPWARHQRLADVTAPFLAAAAAPLSLQPAPALAPACSPRHPLRGALPASASGVDTQAAARHRRRAPHDGCCTRCRGRPAAETSAVLPPRGRRAPTSLDVSTGYRAAETSLVVPGPPAGDVRDLSPCSGSPPSSPLLSLHGRPSPYHVKRQSPLHRRDARKALAGHARRAMRIWPLKIFRPGTRASPVGHCLPAIRPGAGVGRDSGWTPLSLLFFFPFVLSWVRCDAAIYTWPLLPPLKRSLSPLLARWR